MGTSRQPGPICGSEEPLVMEEGTLPRDAMPLPGPEGVELSLGESEFAVHDVMETVEDEAGEVAAEEGHEAFWTVFDDIWGDWAGSTIPQAFKMRLSGTVFYVKRSATQNLYEYAVANFTGAGTYHALLSFPMSALARGLQSVLDQDVLGPLLAGKVDRLGTEEEPLAAGSWEFSLESVDGVIEVTRAVCKRSIASV